MAATTDSVFQLGSIAKVYTATLIMRLAESRAVRGALPRAVGRAGRGGDAGALRPARRARRWSTSHPSSVRTGARAWSSP
ncbi:beta-lactamase family protein [Streptomyces globisporus]|nr:beta-lactamase family protein [Streptomyces globisporus]